MLGFPYRFVWILIVSVLGCSICTTADGQKVGSPEWKREFERKKEEFDRKFAASRAKMKHNQSASSAQKRSTIGNSTSRDSSRTNFKKTPTSGPAKSSFNASQAPSPIACLKSFQKAANSASSMESLLPYLSEMQRSNHAAAKKWGSKRGDSPTFHRDLLNSIVRYDDVRIKGNVAYVDVVRKKGNFNTGTFTLKGEGNLWRMEAYKDKMTSNFIPPAPGK
jgi:hypothetical protein